MRKRRIVIRNGYIFTGFKTSTILKGKSILIEDGYIKEISSKVKERDCEIIDASGCIVMPGFINAHMHFYSSLVKGFSKIKPSKDFIEVLKNLWWRVDKALDRDATYYSALVGCISAIKAGTTTIIDHHSGPGYIRGSLFTIEEAIRMMGIRACLCYEVSDRDGKRARDEGIEENKEFIQYTLKKNDNIISALFGIHASFTVSDETLKKCAEVGNSLGVGFHLHCAESAKDEELCLKRYGERVVERFDRFNITGSKSIFAHCVYVNDKEISILSKTNTAVVINPQSNTNNAVGIADIIKFVKKGVITGLGTDAMTLDMLEEARSALFLSHLKNSNPSIGFEEVLKIMRNNIFIAERYFKDIGEIAPQMNADIVIFDYNPPTPLTKDNFFSHLIFGISQSSCRDVICGGKILMRNRRLTFVDEDEILKKSQKVAKRLWSRI